MTDQTDTQTAQLAPRHHRGFRYGPIIGAPFPTRRRPDERSPRSAAADHFETAEIRTDDNTVLSGAMATGLRSCWCTGFPAQA